MCSFVRSCVHMCMCVCIHRQLHIMYVTRLAKGGHGLKAHDSPPFDGYSSTMCMRIIVKSSKQSALLRSNLSGVHKCSGGL